MYESWQFFRWMVKNCKMSMNSANCWFAIDRGWKFALFIGFFNIKKDFIATFPFRGSL